VVIAYRAAAGGGSGGSSPRDAPGPAARILAAAASAWMTLALVLAAAVCTVLGARLSQATATFGAGQLLSLTVPQVLCIVVVARLLAAVLVPDQPILRRETATEGEDLP
jgi:hypothetical protein